MTTEATIDYEALQQDAMRGVVRAALYQVVKSGLPGDHHFYVSFLTQSPGVILSKRLKEKYPHEMTIVLQHRFWDLIVNDERFEVKLTFDGIPERLVVPFGSIKVFIDPSVRFGLQFEDAGGQKTANSDRRTSLTMDAAFDQIGEAQADSPRATLTKKPRTARRPKSEKDALDTPANTVESPRPTPAMAIPQTPAGKPAADPAAATAAKADEATSPAADKSGAQILSLDQFRKK
jgi:uncharacterized protein